MLYYTLLLSSCYALTLLIIRIRHPFFFREMFYPDSFEDIIFPQIIMYVASPIFLSWVIYDEFIKKED